MFLKTSSVECDSPPEGLLAVSFDFKPPKS